MSLVRIAHLSDPHFGTVYPEVETALLDRLRSLAPDVVVFTGDITQRARKSQFIAARAFREKLSPVPVLAVPGNHDIPLFNIFARVFAPYHGFRKHFHPAKDISLRLRGVEVLALNSTKPWRHVQGAFSPREISRKIPAKAPGVKLRIAAFHHPLDCSSSADETNLLRGREKVVNALGEREIDLVIGGHIHDPHFSLSDSRYPRAARTLVLATAGTCLSWRIRLNAPNSFHWIEAQTEPQASLKITRFELNKSFEFQPGLSERFQRGERESWQYYKETP